MRVVYIVHKIDESCQVLHNNMPPTTTPHATKRGLNAEHDVPIIPLFVALPGVAVTLVATEPIVADGGGAFTPFSPSAAAESDANPTEAGLYLKTENTFFCVHSISQTEIGNGFEGRRLRGTCHRRSSSEQSHWCRPQRTRRRMCWDRFG